MAHTVAAGKLWERVAEFGPRAFLVTVGPDGRPHVVSVSVRVEGTTLVAEAGRTSRGNVGRSGVATLLWPPADGDGAYALIVDGDADGADDEIVVRHPRGVLHRLAGADEALPNCVRLTADANG